MSASVPADGPIPGPTADGTPDRTVRSVPTRAAAVHGDYERLPQRLSFSRASDYRECPKKFYFKTILGITEPNTVATVRGNIAHEVFERIFDHPAGERTLELALSYVTPAWQKLSVPQLDPETHPAGSAAEATEIARAASYRAVCEADSAEEAEMLTFVEECVRTWFDMERVNNFSPTGLQLPDGTIVDGRELHAAANVLGVPLHGFIDRLDRWEDAAGNTHWSVSDYKSGKVPGEGKQYAQHTMDRIVEESFDQLKLYAVLCYEMLGIRVELLRLLYVKRGVIKTHTFTRRDYERTSQQMQALWASIEKSAKTGVWQAKTGPLCNWCYFQDVCPATGGAELGELLPEEIARRLADRKAA